MGGRLPALVVLTLLFTGSGAAQAVDAATGDTRGYVVLLSNESFTPAMRDRLEQRLSVVEQYYESRAPAAADLNLSWKIQPVATGSEDGRAFAGEALHELGFTGRRTTMMKQLVAEQKAAGFDNVAVLFIVPDVGRSYMVGRGAAEHATIYFYRTENRVARLFGVDETPPAIYAHELGHLFGAVDEEAGDESAYGMPGWAAAGPMKRLYPNFNRPPATPTTSLMRRETVLDSIGWFRIQTPLSPWARGMIGWRDFDMDMVLDPFDPVTVSFPENRVPLLNAAVDVPAETAMHSGVTATARFAYPSMVDAVTFRLLSPRGQVVDEAVKSPRSGPVSAVLDLPQDRRPGNWQVSIYYGEKRAAWYEIDVAPR